jgi:hypothetical protein
MVRLFVDYDGDILAHEEWEPTRIHTCFWCDQPLLLVRDTVCPMSLGHTHDFITLCEGNRDGQTTSW